MDNFEVVLKSLSSEHLDDYLQHYYKTVDDANKQKRAAIRLEEKRLEKNIKLSETSQYFALIISVLAILSGSFLVWFNHDIAGSVIGSVGPALVGFSKYIKHIKKFIKLSSDI